MMHRWTALLLLSVATIADRPTPPPAESVRVEISVAGRRLTVFADDDTLHSTRASVASGKELVHGKRRWRFTTPLGTRRIVAKREEPVWRPPDWHYVEVAQSHGLRVRRLPSTGFTTRDGAVVTVRDSVVGLVAAEDGVFHPLPIAEHIVFDSTLIIPPIGTANRELPGSLGAYALDMGDGYLIHGSLTPETIGTAETHGCIRLADADLEWVYRHVPVGAQVQIRR